VPTIEPTIQPTIEPTFQPTIEPTIELDYGNVSGPKRVFLVGPTGAGKSRLANKLLNSKSFKVSSSSQSCTQNCIEQSASIPLSKAGSVLNLTIIDTPGLGDTQGKSHQMTDEIIKCMRGGAVDMIFIVYSHNKLNTGVQNNLKVLKKCLNGFDDNSTALVLNKIPSAETLNDDSEHKTVDQLRKEDQEGIEAVLGLKFSNVVYVDDSPKDKFQHAVQQMFGSIIRSKCGMNTSELRTWSELIAYYNNIINDTVDAGKALNDRLKHAENQKSRLENDRAWHVSRIKDCTLAAAATCWIPIIGLAGIGLVTAVKVSEKRIPEIDAELKKVKQEIETLRSKTSNAAEEKKHAQQQLEEMKHMNK
jgi:GTPase SAR1 family protein